LTWVLILRVLIQKIIIFIVISGFAIKKGGVDFPKWAKAGKVKVGKADRACDVGLPVSDSLPGHLAKCRQ